MKNIKAHIANKAGLSLRHIDYLLKGERDATAKTARLLESVSGVPKEVWVFGSSDERLDAWQKVVRAHSE